MPPTPDFHAQTHNHTACIHRAMNAATALCQQQGLRFTPIRQRVLELVWASHAPMAAYDLLKTLRREKDNAEAPTVYRALDFLLKHGIVHKIESLNAFVGCDHPGDAHTSQFLICTVCGQIVEQENIDVRCAIEKQALGTGFTISDQTIEIMGRCSTCKQ